MTTRLAGIVLLACAAALAALPALDWYSATVPQGTVTASGLDVSGVLWLVPFLAVVIALAGAALAAARPDRRMRVARWAGPLALVAALLALAAALWAGIDSDVTLSVTGENVAATLDVPVDREPAGWLTPAAAMVASAVALAVSVMAWRP
jgi:hypothetical protein